MVQERTAMRHLTKIGAMLLLTAGSLAAVVDGVQADPGGVPGEISQLQQQVATLQGQVQSIQSNDASVNSTLTSLEGQVQSLQSSNSALSASVTSLQGQVQTIQGNESALSATLTSAIAALSAQISQLQTTMGGVAQPGPTLWTYYDTTAAFTACGAANADPDGCNVGGNGDNIIRLINPNGSPNANLLAGQTHTVCAMIYVLDDDQEMGECCGCPISSAGFATFSVLQNLTNNWALIGGPENGDHSNGAIAIIAAAMNTPVIAGGAGNGGNGNGCPIGQGAACKSGCDPTSTPGYSVTNANNLLGTVTHNQEVAVTPPAAPAFVTGLTEVNLSNDGSGDPTNLTYLQLQCNAIVGNGSGSGICNCPVE
jgi:hypothetical protein